MTRKISVSLISQLTKSTIGLSEVDNTSDVNKPASSTVQTSLDSKAPLTSPDFTGDPKVNGSSIETRAARGVANGYAALGADGKVPSVNLPDNGSYKGNWNASINAPTITAGTGTNGDTYTVSVAGTQSVTGSSVTFAVGDQLRFTTNGNKWERIPNTQSVSSVAGLVGTIDPTDLKTALTLVRADVGLPNVNNTSDANKPISNATQTALNSINTDLIKRAVTFISRASLVSGLALLALAPVGVIVSAGGFFYEKDGTSTALTDMPGWKPFEKPSFAHFGADMTGTLDVAPQIQACLNAYKECHVPPDMVKHRVSTVTATGWIRGTRGKSFLLMNGTDIPIKMYGTVGTINSINVNANVTAGTREVTFFSSLTDLVPGQWVLMEADTPPILNMNSSGTAEIVQIESITGQTVRFMQSLAFSYPLGVTRQLRRVNWAKNCGVEGVDIQGSYTAAVSSSIPGLPLIDFRFCEAPVANNNHLHDHNYTAINFIGCHGHRASNNYIHDLMSADDDVNGGFGYGVHEQAVNLGGVVIGNNMERCRTGYTTGAGYPSVYKYGVPMNTLVTGNTMSSMFSGGCSSHEAGLYLSFIGNTINGCRTLGINVRGQGHIVQGNVITNIYGTGIQVVSSPNGDVKDTIVIGNILIRTNQGLTPGTTDPAATTANIGAINCTGPDVIIKDNVIKYPGGQGIRFNYGKNIVVRNNTIVNPCQSEDCTLKWAIGAAVVGGTGAFAIIGGNDIISTDGKMVKPINNPGGFTFHDGGGNVSPGYTISLVA